MSKTRIVTTSWDDGDPQDLKVAELLSSRGLTGTFYIPNVGYEGRKTMNSAGLRSLRSGGFEIGAHGVSHTILTGLNQGELAREVRISKSTLENILLEPVEMFCYPNGKHDARVVQEVKEAGYKGARTTRMLSQALDFNPFQMPTSLLVEPHLRKRYAKNLTRAANLKGMYAYLTEYVTLESWVSIGRALFDRVMDHGGVWHLYGHSWKIEELLLWDDLSEIMEYVSHREGVRYVSNSEVLKYLPTKTGSLPVNH